MSSPWSAAQYVKFEDERTRPAHDLLAQVPDLPDGTLFDIGCGPGNSTDLVADRFPGRRLVGVDSDADMLDAARRRLKDVTFVAGNLVDWAPIEPPALLFANAVLQWMPDPADTILRLAGLLTPGGVLAVQMPDNLGEPTHRAMREIAESPPFSGAYEETGFRSGRSDAPRRVPVRAALPTPETLIDRLSPLSRRVDVWHTIYYHRLAGPEAIVEWVKGTGLRPFLDPLDDRLKEAFLDAYLERIRALYRPLEDGRVLLRFPRLFLVAVRDRSNA